MASLDTILDLMLRAIVEKNGGKIVSTGKFTGDDGDGVYEASDVANPNTIRVRDDGRLIVGGRDVGGNYRFDFGDKDAAEDSANEFKAFLAALGGSGTGTDLVELVLKSAAVAYGGRLNSDGNFNGDDAGDDTPFSTGNGAIALIDGSGASRNDIIDTVRLQGTGVSGNFQFTFGSNEEADEFADIARLIVQWGAANF